MLFIRAKAKILSSHRLNFSNVILAPGWRAHRRSIETGHCLLVVLLWVGAEAKPAAKTQHKIHNILLLYSTPDPYSNHGTICCDVQCVF